MMHGVSQPIAILYGGGVGLACAHDGELRSDDLHGLFAGDTRVLSTYRLTIAGYPWRLLSRSRPSPASAQWDLQNPAIRVPTADLEEGDVHLRVRRQVLGAMHDDLAMTSFADRPVALRLALLLDGDFSDLFEVKERAPRPRLAVRRIARDRGFTLIYEREGFRRALHVTFEASRGEPVLHGAQVFFDLVLEPREPWRCCVTAIPELDGRRIELCGDPHVCEPQRSSASVEVRGAELVVAPFDRGCIDLEHLAMPRAEGGPFVAAGAPWFLALFGRDTLVTSLMAGAIGSWHVEGALSALAATQATADDEFRDAEPGKIAHELRHGELAHFGAIPHTPYYGTHDAPALYVLALWNAYRWTGRREMLDEHLHAAEAALRWCAEAGDEDGDGLLEYRTHSREGYLNQGWKDAHDAILHANGEHAEPPIATVELQAYWYTALLAMAEIYEVLGDHGRAETYRRTARDLRRRVERRFWLDGDRCYALALDGKKRVVRSIASNAGHLLWCGLPTRARAEHVARRLLAPDMFSGYGVRTLSAKHVRYNPLSYQRGSVWPHDNALIAAGLARYGLHDEAARVLRGILDAAAVFEDARLPELFCGFDREDGEPVAYEKANVPQAWAAASAILAVQLFLGLVPDAPSGRCYLSPWLPEWVPELAVHGIRIGDGRLDISLARDGDHTRIVRLSRSTLDVCLGAPIAPLWGVPIDVR